MAAVSLLKKASFIGPLAILALAMTVCLSCADQIDLDSFSSSSIETFSYRIVDSYPHDPHAFTQGLVYYQGEFYEGTGLYGRSSLRRVKIETGEVLEMVPLKDDFFAEGIAIWEDRIIQLTWKSRQGFVWDRENLTKIGDFTYRTEGWGLTSNETRLIMSDGSDTLYFLDPENYSMQGTLMVTASGEPVRGINELEYIEGMIYANLWPSSWIAIISPETGEVTGRIDLSGILEEGGSPAGRVDVLNGIAYDPSEERLFVTGKLWPRLFEIELVEEKSGHNSLFDPLSS